MGQPTAQQGMQSNIMRLVGFYRLHKGLALEGASLRNFCTTLTDT